MYVCMHTGLGSLPGKDVGVGIKSGDLYYGHVGAFSVENVKTFIDSFQSGTLVGKERSNKPPSSSHNDDEGDDSDSAVVTLTDANFDEVVTSSTADALVEFYAPVSSASEAMYECGNYLEFCPIFFSPPNADRMCIMCMTLFAILYDWTC
jgi:hypothetical protein